MTATATTGQAVPKRLLRDRLPVVHQLRQSVGLQRGMLVDGLIITAGFVLTTIRGAVARVSRRPGICCLTAL